METIAEDKDESKFQIGNEKQICRCCLSTEREMRSAVEFQQYFLDLASINVAVSDGVPQWICYECIALMKKAVRFKYKILQAHSMLYEYLMRCAPFSVEPTDPELARYRTPQLSLTYTLAFDSAKAKIGFHKVLQMENQLQKSILYSVPLAGAMQTMVENVKEETHTDHEDDLPLQELSPTKEEIEDDVKSEPGLKRKKRDKESKSRRKTKEESPECPTKEEIEDDVKSEPGLKRKKRDKESKSRRKTKEESPECEDSMEIETPRKSSIRKPIEIDPKKIRIIDLNPEEWRKQREEECKKHVKFPFQCMLCYKGFNFKTKLQNHMSKHSPSRGTYECKLCSMYLPTMYSFNVHSLIHTRRYECVECGRRMIDRASIYQHYRTQHEGIATLITCDLCGKVSSNNKTHRGHIRNHHSGARVKCDLCGKTFVNKDSLTEHMMIHAGVKNYECPICGKMSRTRTQMKHHQLKHSNSKEFYCVECDARFKSAHSLRQHLNKSLKHKDVNSLPFPCSRCNKRFETTTARDTHVLVQHDGVRAFPCSICGARLATASSRDKHARRHLARTPPPPKHVCDTCGKAFRGKSVLTNHLRTHTGEKPFPCALCGRAFSQRTARATHVKLVHLKLRRNKPIKEECAVAPPPPDPKPDLFPKNEPQIVYDSWSRPCDVFYVTAGP